nr:chitin synthase chs-2-like [Nomia melanderi]
MKNLVFNMSNLEETNNLNSSLFADFENYDDDFSELKNGSTIPQQSIEQNILSWDVFKHFPLKKESESMQNNKWLGSFVLRIIKFFMYGIIFCIVFCCILIAKSAVLFAVSQLDEEHSVNFYDYSGAAGNINAKISKEGRIIWTWYIIFMFLVPECFSILQSIWHNIFKKKEKMPKKGSLVVLFILETLHPIGLALLVFYSLPKINSIEAAALCSCISFIPVLINLLSQNRKYSGIKIFILCLLCNILAFIAQGSGLIIHYFLYYDAHDAIIWILPLSLLLSSCRWWINYISDHSYWGFIRFLAAVKADLTNNQHLLQGYIAFWRCLIFILSASVISIFKGIQFQEFFKCLFMNHYNVKLVQFLNSSVSVNELITNYNLEYNEFQQDNFNPIVDTSAPLYIFLIQIFCSFFAYKATIFAYKTQMHKCSVALPLSLITPGSIGLMVMFCVMKNEDSYIFDNIIPDYLFFNEPIYNNIKDFILSWRVWCWIIWWLSQIWITIHVWFDQKEKLAPVKNIFYNSTYDSLIIDQFIGLNKRKYNTYNTTEEEELFDLTTQLETDSIQGIEKSNRSDSGYSEENINNRENACITQIYACATMWHENKEEMMELIGSILRLDKDQCAMKVTQKYYKIFIKDYYELDTHIFFDDAFCCIHGCTESCNHLESETQINQYVVTFLETMQEAVKNLGIASLPPTKYPTPYGGQLIWTLPGKTCLTVHLKDKNKIRHRKRWSQVMYMYYLLGFRLMGLPIDMDRKELLTQNTYILTLDGDIDFRPTSVKALIDLMRKDKELGAVCGRIHPVGKGPMIWFQKFEYAIGHWLQKSTEHTIGSVLCSPGCFSLFRAKALMQHNVIAKYATKSTEPKHYIQYDQGEDRWLCTLLLQAGCRVEYCAAGDAYTHAPETFKEFYIQRRRWISSTMANIFDLLNTAKETRKLNNNISWLYIAYQWILTGSTIIGPSFIYLMMAGAFVAAFQIDNWSSFWYNLIPLLVFIVICFFCQDHIQLIVAEFISVIYALVMIIVLVGILLQIAAEGSFAPNILLFYIVLAQFALTGFMHPHEISCLNFGIIYYITVPSMYMLLIIYSIFNVHNVTWGTRESKQQTKASEEANKLQSNEKFKNNWKNSSFVNFFKYVFCTCSSQKEEEYLKSIYNAINEINIRLETIESNYRIGSISKDNIEETNNNESTGYVAETDLQTIKDDLYISEDSESENSVQSFTNVCNEYSTYLINPNWLQSKHMQHGKVDFLSTTEEQFWKQLIAKYLHPIEKDEEKEKIIKKGLMKIRTESLLKFFTINTLFVVAIFLLQINKDVLNLPWPFAVKYNITYDEGRMQVYVTREYMRLEPIGCLFIIAFVTILTIQFLAMLVHRLHTFTHIIANVKLNLPFPCKAKDESDNLITTEYALNIIEGLQSAVENETVHSMTDNEMYYSKTQKTIHELMKDDQSSSKISTNFEILFNRKLRENARSGFSNVISPNVPKNALEAFENHRSTIIKKRKKRLPLDIIYTDSENGEASNFNSKNTNKTRNYEYDNPAYLNDKEN